MKKRWEDPAIPADILQEQRGAFRARVAHLRDYIDALTLPPDNPLDVVAAVTQDLVDIANLYEGSFPLACGERKRGGD